MWIPRHNGRKQYAPLPAVNLYGHRKVCKWLFHDTSGSPPEWHPAGKAFLPDPSIPCRIRHARCPNAHCSPAPEEQNAGIYLREYAFPTAFHRQPAGKRAHSSDETPLNNPQYPPKAYRHKEIPAPHAHNHWERYRIWQISLLAASKFFSVGSLAPHANGKKHPSWNESHRKQPADITDRLFRKVK